MAHGEGPLAGRRARVVVADGARLHAAARAVLGDHERAVQAVREALAPIREELATRELESIPLARLKDVTEGRLRLGAIEAAGHRSVRDVLDAGRYQLRQIAGVGAQTADQALAAARQLAQAVEETVAVRIDLEHPQPRTTALVIALHGSSPPGRRRAARSARPSRSAPRSARCSPGPRRPAAGS